MCPIPPALLTPLHPNPEPFARYEAHHRCSYTPAAIAAAVRLAVRHLPDRQLPDKAIDLMDEAGSRARIASHAARARLAGAPDGLAQQYQELLQARALSGPLTPAHCSRTALLTHAPPSCAGAGQQGGGRAQWLL